MPPKQCDTEGPAAPPLLLNLLQAMGLTNTAAALLVELQQQQQQQQDQHQDTKANGASQTAASKEEKSSQQQQQASASTGAARRPVARQKQLNSDNVASGAESKNSQREQQQHNGGLTKELLKAAKAPLSVTHSPVWDESLRAFAALTTEPLVWREHRATPVNDIAHASTALFESLYTLAQRADSEGGAVGAPPPPIASTLCSLLVEYYRMMWLQQLLVESAIEADLLPHPPAGQPSLSTSVGAADPPPSTTATARVDNSQDMLEEHPMPKMNTSNNAKQRGRRFPVRAGSDPSHAAAASSGGGSTAGPGPQAGEGSKFLPPPHWEAEARGQGRILVLASQLQGAVQSLHMQASSLLAQQTATSSAGETQQEQLLRRVLHFFAPGEHHVSQWQQNAERVVQWVLYRYAKAAPGQLTKRNSSSRKADKAEPQQGQQQQQEEGGEEKSTLWGNMLADLHDAVTKVMDISAALYSPENSTEHLLQARDTSTESISAHQQQREQPSSATSSPATRTGAAEGRDTLPSAPHSSVQRQKLAYLQVLFTLSRTRLALWGLQSLYECVWALTQDQAPAGGTRPREECFPLESAASVMQGQWACTAATLLQSRNTDKTEEEGENGIGRGEARQKPAAPGRPTTLATTGTTTTALQNRPAPRGRQRQPPQPPRPGSKASSLSKEGHAGEESAAAPCDEGPVSVALATALDAKVASLAQCLQHFAKDLLLFSSPSSSSPSSFRFHRVAACANLLNAISLRFTMQPLRLLDIHHPSPASGPSVKEKGKPKSSPAATATADAAREEGARANVADALVYYNNYVVNGCSNSSSTHHHADNEGDGGGASNGDKGTTNGECKGASGPRRHVAGDVYSHVHDDDGGLGGDRQQSTAGASGAQPLQQNSAPLKPVLSVEALRQSVADRSKLESLMRALTTGRLAIKSPRNRRPLPLRRLLHRALGHQQTLLDFQSIRMPIMIQLRALQHASAVAPSDKQAAAKGLLSQQQQQQSPLSRRVGGSEQPAEQAAGFAVHISEGDTFVSGSVQFPSTGYHPSPPMLGIGNVPPSLLPDRPASPSRGGPRGAPEAAEEEENAPESRPSAAAGIRHMAHVLSTVVERLIYASDRTNRQTEGSIADTDTDTDATPSTAGGDEDSSSSDPTSDTPADEVEEVEEDEQRSQASSTDMQFNRPSDEILEEVQQVAVTPCGSLMALLTTRARLVVYSLKDADATGAHTTTTTTTSASYREELLIDTTLPGSPYHIHWYDLCSVVLQFSPDGRFLLAAVQLTPTAAPEGAEDMRTVPGSTGRICIYSLHRDLAPAVRGGGESQSSLPSSSMPLLPATTTAAPSPSVRCHRGRSAKALERDDSLFPLPDRLYGEVKAHNAPVTCVRWVEPQFWGGGWTRPEDAVVMPVDKLNNYAGIARHRSVLARATQVRGGGGGGGSRVDADADGSSVVSISYSNAQGEVVNHTAKEEEVERSVAWRGAAKAHLASMQCFSAGLDNYITRWLPSSGIVLQRIRTPPVADLVVSPLMSALYVIDADGHLAMYDAWNERNYLQQPRPESRRTVAVRERGLPASLALLRTVEETANRAQRIQAEPLADLDLPDAFFAGTRVVTFDRSEIIGDGGGAEEGLHELDSGRSQGTSGRDPRSRAPGTETDDGSLLPTAARGTASQQAASLGRRIIMQVLNERVTAPQESQIVLSPSSSSLSSVFESSDGEGDAEAGRVNEEVGGDDWESRRGWRHRGAGSRRHHHDADDASPADTVSIAAVPGEGMSRVRYRSGTRLHFVEVGRALCHVTGIEPTRTDRRIGPGGAPYRLLSMTPSAQPSWAAVHPVEEEAQYQEMLRLWWDEQQQQQRASGSGAGERVAANAERHRRSSSPAARNEEAGDAQRQREQRLSTLLLGVRYYTEGSRHPRGPSATARASHPSFAGNGEHHLSGGDETENEEDEEEAAEKRAIALRRAHHLRGRTTHLKPTASNGRYLSVLAAVGPYRMLVDRTRPLEHKPGIYASLIFDVYTSTVLRVIPICPVQPNPLLVRNGTVPSHSHAKKAPIYTLQSTMSVVARRAPVARGSRGAIPSHPEDRLLRRYDLLDEGLHEEEGRRGDGPQGRPRRNRGSPEEGEEEMLVLSVGGLHDTVYVYEALTGDRIRTVAFGQPAPEAAGTKRAPPQQQQRGTTNSKEEDAVAPPDGAARRSFEDVLSSVNSWDTTGMSASMRYSASEIGYDTRAAAASPRGVGINALIDAPSQSLTPETESEDENSDSNSSSSSSSSGDGPSGDGDTGRKQQRVGKARRHDTAAAAKAGTTTGSAKGRAEDDPHTSHHNHHAATWQQQQQQQQRRRGQTRRQQLYDTLVRRFGPAMVLQAQVELLRVVPPLDEDEENLFPGTRRGIDEEQDGEEARNGSSTSSRQGEREVGNEDGEVARGTASPSLGLAANATGSHHAAGEFTCFLRLIHTSSDGNRHRPHHPQQQRMRRRSLARPSCGNGAPAARRSTSRGSHRYQRTHHPAVAQRAHLAFFAPLSPARPRMGSAQPFVLASHQLEEVRRTLTARLSSHVPHPTSDTPQTHDNVFSSRNLAGLFEPPASSPSSTLLGGSTNAIASAQQQQQQQQHIHRHHHQRVLSGIQQQQQLAAERQQAARSTRLYCGVVNCVATWGDGDGVYLLAGVESGRLYLAGGPLGKRSVKSSEDTDRV